MNGLGLTLGLAAGLAAVGAARRGSRSSVISVPIRWGDLPDDIRSDAFVIAALQEHGIGRSIRTARINVLLWPMATLWSLVRQTWPGTDDANGCPKNLDTEEHWDDRGPAHVVTLVNLMRAVWPTAADRASAETIATRWMKEDRSVTYAEPDESEAWDGHSSRASTVTRLGSPYRGMLMPPVFVDAWGVLDGRHRLFAARIAGLAFVPTIDLRTLRVGEDEDEPVSWTNADEALLAQLERP